MDIINHAVANFDDIEIEVNFLVIHYTALDLNQTLKKFNHPQSKASSHFVIDQKGFIYECVPALQLLKKSNQKSCAKKAWHCGQSSYGHKESLNDFSIGIELVHLNGNFFQYSNQQYQSLIALSKKLMSRYPNLNHPKQIIGHENIAVKRGKVDPGIAFDWSYYLMALFGDFAEKQIHQITQKRARISPKIYRDYKDLFTKQTGKLSIKSPFWAYFNNWLEYSQRQIIDNNDSNG